MGPERKIYGDNWTDRFARRPMPHQRHLMARALLSDDIDPIGCSNMNFMPPNLAQTTHVSATPLSIPGTDAIGLPKLIAVSSVAIVSLLGTAAWIAFLVRIAWSVL
jgi:hypothetical protein